MHASWQALASHLVRSSKLLAYCVIRVVRVIPVIRVIREVSPF